MCVNVFPLRVGIDWHCSYAVAPFQITVTVFSIEREHVVLSP